VEKSKIAVLLDQITAGSTIVSSPWGNIWMGIVFLFSGHELISQLFNLSVRASVLFTMLSFFVFFALTVVIIKRMRTTPKTPRLHPILNKMINIRSVAHFFFSAAGLGGLFFLTWEINLVFGIGLLLLGIYTNLYGRVSDRPTEVFSWIQTALGLALLYLHFSVINFPVNLFHVFACLEGLALLSLGFIQLRGKTVN